ncbi:hypothetical protein [Oceanibaculum pacificum]|uniref:hypothetical protein n=1 Tax=Oceanibaculum pacificum TaxID=580166 RepID=UPI0012EECCF8|nr:hypothetical protein [Oceanibaculum pacificum]
MKDTPTAEQLRHRIDKGATGDKVPAHDPAAAPLGTDDEAAGAPPTKEELQAAHRDRPTVSERAVIAADSPKRPSHMPLLLGAVATLLALLAWLFFLAD